MDSSKIKQLASTHRDEPLIAALSPLLAPLGYRIIHLEIQTHRQKTLRIYIDHLQTLAQVNLATGLNTSLSSIYASQSRPRIGIEDCVKASHALNAKLNLMPEVETLLPGTYELEVSSPGADRPLRVAQDYLQHVGHRLRLHLYRPMTLAESENPVYQQKNPKQKNFLGTLIGLKNDKIILLPLETSTNSVEGSQISIPLPLISKANLEPDFNFEECHERESS